MVQYIRQCVLDYQSSHHDSMFAVLTGVGVVREWSNPEVGLGYTDRYVGVEDIVPYFE